jgi:hypothetical protein
MKKNKNIKTVDESIINWELYQKIRSERIKRQILSFKIGPLRIRFVFRHKFEKYRTMLDDSSFRSYELGFWFKRTLCVGTKKKGRASFSKDNLCPEYMIGINLLVAKLWLTVSWNVLEFEV